MAHLAETPARVIWMEYLVAALEAIADQQVHVSAGERGGGQERFTDVARVRRRTAARARRASRIEEEEEEGGRTFGRSGVGTMAWPGKALVVARRGSTNPKPASAGGLATDWVSGSTGARDRRACVRCVCSSGKRQRELPPSLFWAALPPWMRSVGWPASPRPPETGIDDGWLR